MPTLIAAWSSKLTHITDDPDTRWMISNIKTRCGRTIKTRNPCVTENECRRCGTASDFRQVSKLMKIAEDNRSCRNQES